MTDLRDQLQQALGTAYAVERELGGGGMARVFVAMDNALGRRVVIKVLTPELAQGLSAERFTREIRLAAALQDPHIVPVHSAGDAGGLPYFTMPFVEGESLRARLLRGGIPFPDAVGILRDVALALEYAHARGIVHRDIKPENVLLSGRTAVVADFGIAKAVSAARTQGPGGPSGTLTSIGQSLGTPAYMAPEQAAGDPTDHRADLYAWGLMAYELLAGRHPFADKATTAQLMAAQVMEQPVPLGDRKPGLPPPLASLVMQCLEKEPAARPQDAAALVQGLDGMQSPSAGRATIGRSPEPNAVAAAPARRSAVALAGGALVIAAIAVIAFVASRRSGATGDGRREAVNASSVATASSHSLAVLPFENLGDSADAYFADGITDAVRGKLIALRDLKVIARGSSVQYRGTQKLPAVIARELGVRYLLTGTVRFATSGGAKRVLVSPELVEVGSDGQPQGVWQQPFDAEVKDVFKVQGDIAGKVAEAMQVALGGTVQAELAKAPTTDAVAYDLYLRGEAAWNSGASSDLPALRRAADFFEQAVQRDSRMVAAWASLSRVSSLSYSNAVTKDPRDATRAKAAAERAMALEPRSTAARGAMANYLTAVEGDRTKALRIIEEALRDAPGDAGLRNAASASKRAAGLLEESAKDARVAVELDPRSARSWDGLATSLVRLRRYPEAREAMARALEMVPNSPTLHQDAMVVEASVGDLAAARRLMARAKTQVAAAPMVAFVATYWDMGWILEKADEELLLTLGPESFDNERAAWAIVRAQQYGWRGDSALARAWGDSASRYFAESIRRAPDDPQLHSIRGLALAYAGKASEAVAEGERATQLTSVTSDVNNGAYFLFLLARTYLLVGRRDDAVRALETLLKVPFHVTPGWLRIDPSWKPLRGDPRFEKLIAAN